MKSHDVRVSRQGAACRLSFDRPEALHALTLEMCQEMSAALADCSSSEAVKADGAECLWAGLATRYLPAYKLDTAKQRIGDNPERIEEILSEPSITPPEAGIAAQADKIAEHYAADRCGEILASLERDEGDWARTQRQALATKSPQTCKVALPQLALGGALENFAEGVCAVLVDKTNGPQWNPATAEEVTEDLLDSIFAPLPAQEEWKPL